MALEFDDLLLVLCSEVSASNANDYQKIYLLSTDLEAKLAFDVLIAFGFNVKVYHTPDKPSKLYITIPKMSADQLEQKLSSAIAYASALKSIKVSLDELCVSNTSFDPLNKPNSFSIAFVNSQPNGKQILIQLSHAITDNSNVTNPAISVTSAGATPIAVKPAQPAVTAYSARVARKMLKKKQEDNLASGPAVGRGLYPGRAGTQEIGKETLRKRIMLRMFGNFATSGYAALMWLVLVAVLFSCVVFAKSFICYDFVAKKSTKWYCQDQAQIAAAEEARKEELEKRQKALGLAPTDTQK